MDSKDRARARRRGKDFERLVATFFIDGHRILQKGFEVPDVEGSAVMVECKYRDRLPGYLLAAIDHVRQHCKLKIPLTFIKQKRGPILVVMHLNDFREIFGEIAEMT